MPIDPLLRAPARSDSFNAGSTGSSNRVARFALLDDPPPLDAGELTARARSTRRRS
jgi:hypothetical protein